MTESAQSLALLCGTAASIGAVHTILGPDHYVPFVAMSRAGRWSLRKTVLITVLCGFGHVLGSVVLGLASIAVGAALFTLESIERFRGDLAGWLLLGFGIAYFTWGVRRAIRNRPHTHWHTHADGTVHDHRHVHVEAHAHAHVVDIAPPREPDTTSMTPWILFTIFVFGPCEPLIPLVMYSAARGRLSDVILVAFVFSLATIATMLTAVLVAHRSIGAFGLGRYERYTHALAGLAIVACGAAIQAGL